jgi:hypothetical protein
MATDPGLQAGFFIAQWEDVPGVNVRAGVAGKCCRITCSYQQSDGPGIRVASPRLPYTSRLKSGGIESVRLQQDLGRRMDNEQCDVTVAIDGAIKSRIINPRIEDRTTWADDTLEIFGRYGTAGQRRLSARIINRGTGRRDKAVGDY